MPSTLLAVLGLFACKPTVCTLEARTSVTVTVTDADGAPLVDAEVSYSLDGGASTICYGGGDSNVHSCGEEQAGAFVIHASAHGHVAQDATVEVVSGECHVEPEALTLALEAADCTDEVRPSIRATVVGTSNEVLEGVVVEYAPEGGDDSAPCTFVNEAWNCGEEEQGSFVVTASAAGHLPESVTVDVEADECHVITEDVTLTLGWFQE